ncbi:DUF2750 domain-containing protein [Clostridium estertheticum]|uniref:DUF2750 domain-containing protein n=1 Tax=Clostridium estertheticum TaxID=238834 RepID=UPI001C7CABE7|nr:DUF2750 domain-containing protein [Clostridium estertheticum]MBX4262265.1 DUF2750 domain-containing protein [Clostridium estertheticum]WLC71991.1 DUF2750 domain-containing protein [Clostridium estertheticum]
MNKKELEIVLSLSANKRYEYFVKKVADSENVLGLYNEGWATTEDNNGSVLIPFWPKMEFAKVCAINEWNGYVPKKIDLHEFIEEWLPGMKKDGIKPSIFWNNYDSGVLDIDILIEDLNTELEKY